MTKEQCQEKINNIRKMVKELLVESEMVFPGVTYKSFYTNKVQRYIHNIENELDALQNEFDRLTK